MVRTLLSAFIFLLALPVSAQEALPADFVPFPGAATNIPETISPLNCFDYYTFGSVQADLQSTVTQTVPGSTLTFTGAVWNANPYPVLDGTLYVKIFRRNETTFAAGDGNEVVDQFIIKEGMTVSASSTIPLQYEWKVPVNAQGGEYYAAYFFTTAKRYNLMGLSFTDDVVGNQAPFTVTAENDIAKLSKVDTTLNDQNHHFAAFPLTFAAGDTVTVKTTITNPTSESKNLPLQWNQYAWDAMNEDNLRFTKTEIVTLKPNETKEVTYQVQAQRESVVYVVAVTQDNEAKSILNIRYVREGIEETRINFPGLTAFPLTKDTEQTLFACAHSTNLPVVPGNTLTLTLKDKAGVTIHEYKYEGDISGAMAGFGNTFTPTKNINYATLTATLERSGVIVEEVTQVYDCALIDPNSCLPEDLEVASVSDYLKTYLMNMILIGALGLLILAGTIFFIKKRRNHIDANNAGMTTPLSLLFFLLILPTFFFFQPGVGEAKSVSWSVTENKSFIYRWGARSEYVAGGTAPIDRTTYGYPGGWATALTNPNITISYQADMYDNSSGALISDGATVPIGTVIRVTPKNFVGSDISWFGTGYSSDSPNGHWITNAAGPDAITCDNTDMAGTWAELVMYGEVHVPLSVNPPTLAYSATGPVSQVGTNLFQVTGAGSIGASVSFASTYGKFYYRYFEHAWTWNWGGSASGPDACYGDNTPLRQGVVNGGDGTSCSYFPSWGACQGIPGSPYQLTVPQQSITFNVTAVASNNSPNTPTLTNCSMNGVVNTSYNFGLTGTDTDGDTLRYGVDLDNNGSVDQWLPGTGYVNSGTNQTLSRSWTSPGTYTFGVLSQDSKGASSGWASCGATITAAPAPTADLTINSSNGPINVAKNTTVNLNWTSANAASCSKWGGTWGSGEAIALTGSGTTVVTATANYFVNCGGVIDTVTVNVVNQTPSAPTVAYTSGTLEVGSNITFSIQGSDPDSDDVFYEVDWDNNGTTDATTMTVPSNTTQPATHSWPTAGTHTFQARTVDVPGGLPSATWTSHQVTVVVAITPPAQPATPALSTTACDINQLNVTWLSVSGATSYDLQYQTSPSGAWTLLTNQTSPHTLTGLTAGATYNVQVMAKNIAGSSSWSPFGTATIPAFCGSSATATITATPPNCQIPLNGTSCTTTVTWSSADTVSPTSLKRGNAERSSAANNSTGITETLTPGSSATFRFYHRTPEVQVGVPVTARATCAGGTAWNGSLCITIPPDPDITFDVSRTHIRPNETVTLSWSIGTYPYPNPYNLTCAIVGPNLNLPSITLPSGTTPTSAIGAKSTFTLTCTEGTTGTSWSESETVETVGVIEET